MPPAAPQLSPLVNAVVVPGDVVLSLSDFAASAAAAGGGAGAPPGAPPALRLGAALLQRDGDIFSSRAGVLRQTGAAKLWVEASAKRYIPSPDDTVVGVVVERHAENFVVDVGGPFHATLPALAFENATRRNRPNLTIGSLVYARVETAPRDMEPTLSCVDANGKAAGMGPLTGGLPFAVSTGAARALLGRPPCTALATLGAALSFELAVGVNGRCWVAAADVATTILVVNALQAAATLPPVRASELVGAMLAAHADRAT